MATQLLSTTFSIDQPLVSVIIPAYNAERFITDTLDSVLAQTYQNMEILVVDDGSNDGTARIVKEYMEKTSKIRLLQQENLGVAAARNLGIRAAKGEFIAPLDADDIWYEQNIERQVNCILAAKKAVGLVYSWSIDINELGQPTGCVRASRITGRVYNTLLLHDFIANASSVLIRKACFEQVGGYDPILKQQLSQGGEDWDIYLRIAEHYDFEVVPEFLVGYRKLPNSMSTDSFQMARSRHLIWQKIRHRYPHVPKFIERLSNSSFYLYLASQNYQYAKYQAALSWTMAALKIDPITPLLRPGVYKIIILALLDRIDKSNFSTKNLKDSYQTKTLDLVSIKPTVSSPANQKFWPLKKPKVLGEIMVHWIASSLFGKIEEWT
ncbi:glycosyltransferase family 2 protein [Nodosilinea sp. PGN35]|uniref:glycosyltransferase family 2 protein n=1 Tax=Nodosilinea sp. PGN35 TaxID=3020489 RepID=UPI0023B2AC12|nr:glycosyltransferase family A protein [Nodosilinea sp. TSF1-S3]MDF0367325.1 glycosyltransferase family A protein [Nodosilinea sp. TSF1-S3]